MVYQPTPTTECNTLKDGQWSHIGQLETPRIRHGASTIRKGIWFTGGIQMGYGPLATTEILNDDGKITIGPKLPEARMDHCQASYKDTILLIGKL